MIWGGSDGLLGACHSGDTTNAQHIKGGMIWGGSDGVLGACHSGDTADAQYFKGGMIWGGSDGVLGACHSGDTADAQYFKGGMIRESMIQLLIESRKWNIFSFDSTYLTKILMTFVCLFPNFKLLACVARGPGFDSRPRHLNFQRLVISCFQVEIWLKDR